MSAAQIKLKLLVLIRKEQPHFDMANKENKENKEMATKPNWDFSACDRPHALL